MKNKPRYDTDHSLIGAVKKRNGDLPYEGAEWTDEDWDRGWTMYLDGLTVATIAQRLGRSRRSVATAIEHKVHDPAQYTKGRIPHYRGKPRAGVKFWTPREDAILDRCLKHNWPHQDIAVLLSRTPEAVRGHIEKRQNQGQPRMF